MPTINGKYPLLSPPAIVEKWTLSPRKLHYIIDQPVNSFLDGTNSFYRLMLGVIWKFLKPADVPLLASVTNRYQVFTDTEK